MIIPVSKGVYDESCFAAEEEERIVEDVIPPTAKLPLMNAEKKWTVLLAEDNNEVRNYVKECLEPYDCQIDGCTYKRRFLRRC